MDKREIFRKIAAEAAKGELAFPTSAQVALKLRQALDDPNCHADTAAKLVQAEPLLSARVIAIANSVIYNRSGKDITDVRMSVVRLGFRTVRSLSMALVTRQMAGQSTDQAHRDLANKLWEHTAHVASLAHVLARRVTHQDPEAALFAGIVHEVGGFYMISRADDFPILLQGDFIDWMEEGEAAVGSAVLKVLSVPASIVSAVETSWDGFLAMPPVSLADTLMLAEELSPVSSPLHEVEGMRYGEDRAASIEMVIGEETLTSILEESVNEVRSLTEALKF